MNTQHDFYLVDELAKKLRVNPMTIYRYIKAGKFPATKIGKEYRIDRETFEAFIKKQTTKTNS